MSITYISGDATNPIGGGLKIIPHVCNDIGAWGRGFVLALSTKWRAPEQEYRMWHRSGHMVDMFNHNEPFMLSSVQFVDVGSGIIVANMIAQVGIYSNRGIPPIRYAELECCLNKVSAIAQNIGAGIHAPKFGAGLAGGNWNQIESIIDRTCRDLSVTVYEYDET